MRYSIRIAAKFSATTLSQIWSIMKSVETDSTQNTTSLLNLTIGVFPDSLTFLVFALHTFGSWSRVGNRSHRRSDGLTSGRKYAAQLLSVRHAILTLARFFLRLVELDCSRLAHLKLFPARWIATCDMGNSPPAPPPPSGDRILKCKELFMCE